MTIMEFHHPERRKKHWVLLVEDNRDHAELVRRTIGQCRPDVAICHAPDGEVARQWLDMIAESETEQNPPAAIILDLRLPRVDGFHILQYQKSHPKLVDIPTFILTSSTSESDMRQARQLEADAYHVKPLDSRACRRMLDGVLTRKEREEKIETQD